jgi:hypothetical protein
MTESTIAHMSELEYLRIRQEIDEVRMVLHAHWVAYNHLGVLTIDYDEWDDIAVRLDRLHEKYPSFAFEGYEAEYFYDWDTDDMFDLPVTPYILEVATKLIERSGHAFDEVSGAA